MSNTIFIRAEKLSKVYRQPAWLSGQRPTIRGLAQSWWNHGARKVFTTTDVPALREVTFEIGPGQTVGLIGPNGAGKSTLLRLIARITSSTSGDLKTQGKVANLFGVRTGFHPELTGLENLLVAGAFHGIRQRDILARIGELSARVDLQGWLERPLKHYSTGMVARLSLGLVLLGYPDILLIDETLSVLDSAFQKKLWESLSERAASGAITVVVSHDIGSIYQYCSRVLRMENGRLWESSERFDESKLAGTRPQDSALC